MNYSRVYALFLLSVFLTSCGQNQPNVPKDNTKSAVTEIMLGGQVMWVLANPGILEADDGSIWFGGFGSMHGVYRYDGKTITVF